MVDFDRKKSSEGIFHRWGLLLLSLIISVFILTIVVQANAETRNWKINNQITKMQAIPIPDSPGRAIGFFERQGEVTYENGETAKQILRCTFDMVRGAGPYQGYSQITFKDGSSFLVKIEGVMIPQKNGKLPISEGKGKYISGTGRYKGIQGNIIFKATMLKPFAGESKGDALVEATGTYTLPSKNTNVGRITFEGLETTDSGDRINLSANLTKPEGEGPFPAVIMMHGCSGDNKFLDPWEKRLGSWGYVVLRLDSLSPRLRTTFCLNDHLDTAESRAQDAYDAKAYLSKLPFVDKDNIALIGWSHGGTAALYAIDENFPIKSRRNPFKAVVTFYPFCTKPLEKQNAPILIFVGGKDQICRAENCKSALTSDKPPHEINLKEYEDAYHCFDWEIDMMWMGNKLEHNPEAAADAISRTQDFLEKSLK